MTKNNQVKLYFDEELMYAPTGLSVELAQELNEYIPLPGSDDDDGWCHYTPGHLTWGLSADHLFTDYSAEYINDFAGTGDQASKEAVIVVGDDFTLSGDIYINELAVQATKRQLARLTAKFVCNGFPILTEL